MTQNEYVEQILRRTGLPRKDKKRLEADLNSDIAARLESGAGMADVMAAMGTPEQMAASLRAGLQQPPLPPKSGWRWAILAVAVVLAVMFGMGVVGLFSAFQPVEQSPSVAIIGGADGPTAIYSTTRLQTGMFAVGSLLPYFNLALTALGIFLLMQWKGYGGTARFVVAGVPLLVLALAYGAVMFAPTYSILRHLGPDFWGALVIGLLHPAFWGAVVVGVMHLRRGLANHKKERA